MFRSERVKYLYMGPSLIYCFSDCHLQEECIKHLCCVSRWCGFVRTGMRKCPVSCARGWQNVLLLLLRTEEL